MCFMPSTAASAPEMVVKVVTRASSDELLLSGTVTKVFEGQFAWKA